MEGPQDTELGRLVGDAVEPSDAEGGAADAPNARTTGLRCIPLPRGKSVGEVRALRRHSRTVQRVLFPGLGLLLLVAGAVVLLRQPHGQLDSAAAVAESVVQAREEREKEKDKEESEERGDDKEAEQSDKEEDEDEAGDKDKAAERKAEEEDGDDKDKESDDKDKESDDKESDEERGDGEDEDDDEDFEKGSVEECKMEDEIDFQTNKALFAMQGIATAKMCQQHCRDYSKCGAWTWGKTRDDWGLMNMCFLKGLGMDEKVKRHKNHKVISGFPCRPPDDGKIHLRKGLDPPSDKLTKTFDVASLMPIGPDPRKHLKGECFCFALMLPGSYEQGLLKMQYRLKANIFACDEHAVYSSSAIEVDKGLWTKVVDSDLKCEKGGEFGTALNTEIFMAVWKKVIIDMTFDDYKWTVKADPDTVFICKRLLRVVKDIHDTDVGVYLNNCKMGMHGPLEVFSRNSIWTWGKGAKECFVYFYNLCSGPCLWGEDMFVDQCLTRKLHVMRDSVYNLLTEDHCDPPDGWRDCKDDKSVAFHPFKKSDEYKECLGNAEPEKYPELVRHSDDDDKDKDRKREKDDKADKEDKEDEEDKEDKEDKEEKERKEEKADDDDDDDDDKDKDDEDEKHRKGTDKDKDKDDDKDEDEEDEDDEDEDEEDDSKCKVESGVDYETKKALYAMEGIVSAKMCRMKCEQINDCGAWTWGKTRDVWGLTNMCFLKVLEKGDKPKKHTNKKVVSGLPCRKPKKHKHHKDLDPSEKMMKTFDLSHSGSEARRSEQTLGQLFGWALMLPGSYEEGLLRWQYQHGANIFGCDAYAVYSNHSIRIAGDFTTSVVNTSLYCQKGGEFGTALNTDIFMRVWKKVILDGIFEKYQWTLKADPDTVMVVTRLRSVLEVYRETDEGVYLNNCRMGLHGPLEVFSRNAVRAWSEGSQKCFHHFYRLCSGPCLWGEDMFIDQCLEKVLKVRKVLVEKLLTEDHCDPPEGWKDCKDPHSVAFHPYKKLSDYEECNANAVAHTSDDE